MYPSLGLCRVTLNLKSLISECNVGYSMSDEVTGAFGPGWILQNITNADIDTSTTNSTCKRKPKTGMGTVRKRYDNRIYIYIINI